MGQSMPTDELFISREGREEPHEQRRKGMSVLSSCFALVAETFLGEEGLLDVPRDLVE